MPSFETLLERLSGHRGWDSATVSRIAGDEVGTPQALRRLAAALGWRAADLFALAQREFPEDLAPTDWGSDPGSLIWEMAYLPLARPILLSAARSMPQLPRSGAAPRSATFPDVDGAVIGLLLKGRNLSIWHAAELLMVAGGPYLAATTIARICGGRKELNPDIVRGFADGLGVPVGDLAALCAVEVTQDIPAPEYAADLADMLWECRRLTHEQIQELRQLGRELRHRFGNGLSATGDCGG